MKGKTVCFGVFGEVWGWDAGEQRMLAQGQTGLFYHAKVIKWSRASSAEHHRVAQVRRDPGRSLVPHSAPRRTSCRVRWVEVQTLHFPWCGWCDLCCGFNS